MYLRLLINVERSSVSIIVTIKLYDIYIYVIDWEFYALFNFPPVC